MMVPTHKMHNPDNPIYWLVRIQGVEVWWVSEHSPSGHKHTCNGGRGLKTCLYLHSWKKAGWIFTPLQRRRQA